MGPKDHAASEALAQYALKLPDARVQIRPLSMGSMLRFQDVARQAQESYLADPGRPLVVKAKNGEEKLIPFDNKPIQDQVIKCCNLFRIPYDDEEHYHVLTKGTDPSAPLVVSQADLAEARALRQALGLRSGIDVVRERIELLQNDVRDGLVGLFHIVRGDPQLSDYIIDFNGMEAMVDIIKGSDQGDEDIVELAMSILCELTPFAMGIERLREMEEEDVFDPTFFRRLIETLLAPISDESPAGEGGESGETGGSGGGSKLRRPPFSVLYGILFFLQHLPDCTHALHTGITGFTQKAGSGDLYPQLGEAVEKELEEEFQGIAASLVLSAMTLAAEEDEDCLKDIKDALNGLEMQMPEEDEDTFFESISNSRHVVSHLLSSAMITSAELTDAVLEGSSGSKARLLERLSRAQSRLDHVTQENAILKAKLRKLHGTMARLSPFVEIDADDFLRDAVDVLLKMGEDGLNLHGGQNILHYAAEHCGNADIVELVGSFLSNPNRADANGKTPLDFAEKAGHSEVIARLRLLQQGNAAKAEQARELAEVEHNLQTKLDRLEALPAKLREVLEEVLKQGYQREWKNGFTAVHLAAKCGHDGAVKWLVEAGGGMHLNESDKWGLTPMDYASQGHHDQTVLLIRKILLEHQQRRPDAFTSSASGALGAGGADGGRRAPSAQLAVVGPGSPSGAGGGGQDLARQAPDFPEDLPPKLRRALEVVCQKGWSNIKWPKDFSPLHLAAQVCSVTTVQLLLECSARPGLEVMDEQGKTPLDYARDNRSAPPELIELLATGKITTPSAIRRSGSQDGKQKTLGVPGVSGGSRMSMMMAGSEHRLLQDQSREIELRHRVAQLEKEMELMKAASTFGGLPNEAAFTTCASALAASGRAAVLTQMKKPVDQGGYGLEEAEATHALETLELVQRLAKVQRGGAGGAAADEPGAEPAAEPAPAADKAGGASAKGGKGKPGAASGEVSAGGGAEAKAGGKGKMGPPVPGSSTPQPGGAGVASDSSEPTPQTDLATLFAKGGPGKGKGKKGPPLPAALGAEASTGNAPEGPGKGKGKAGPKGAPGMGAPGPKAKPKQVPPTKPSPKPKAKLRKFWWVNDKYKLLIFDRPELPRGISIWDKIGDDTSLIPLDEFEELFSEATIAPKASNTDKDDNADAKKKDELTIIRIITDGNLVASIESTLKRLPAVDKVAAALTEFDTDILSIDDLKLVKQYVCPTHEQFAQLTGLKTMHPDVPLAMPEQYMWALGNLGSAKERAECWQFCREAPDDLRYPREALADFSLVIDGIQNSKAIQQLFGYLLACGNYLNAGTARGQADGFHIPLTFKEALNVKGKGDMTLTRFVIDSMHKHRPEVLKQLVEDVMPICLKISRAWVKKEGDDELKKEPMVQLNEFEICIKGYKNNCERMRSSMQQVLKTISDPTDPFKLRMPVMIEQVSGDIANLSEVFEACQKKYLTLLSWLRLEESMKSGEFCLVWDDFFIPESLVNKMDSKMKKQFAQPAFVQGKATRAFTVEDLLVLWGIEEYKPPKPPKPPAAKVGTGDKKAKRGSVAVHKPKGAKAGGLAKASGRGKRKAWHSDHSRGLEGSPGASFSELSTMPPEVEEPQPRRKLFSFLRSGSRASKAAAAAATAATAAS